MQVDDRCHRLFVYGTLKRGECRERCWPHQPLAVEPATTAGCLYDLGEYPALAVGDGIVLGELWLIAEQHLVATLAVLDEIEGYAKSPNDLYVRRVVTCCTRDGAEHQAQTYFYARAEHLTHRKMAVVNRAGEQEWSAKRG